MLITIVCKKYKIHPAEVFKFAIEYAEILMSKDDQLDYYIKCCRKTRNNTYVIDVEPEFVNNFCLDILAKRTTLPDTYQKIIIKKGGKNETD